MTCRGALRSLDAAWGVRGAIIAHAIMFYGFSTDLMWHAIHPLREFYFIPPHIIIYIGITLLLASLAFLRLKGCSISLWVFVAYPLLSVFDEFWHRTYGIELATSPLAFWSPAHWSVIVLTWYMMFSVYKTGAEKVPIIILFLKSLVFFVLPVRLLMYLAIPLAPYSYIDTLQNPLNHLVTVTIVLFICSLHYYLQENNILLVGMLSLFALSGPYLSFFMPYSQEYGHASLVRLLFLTVMICLVSIEKSRMLYMFFGALTGILMLTVPFLSGATLSVYVYVFIIGSSTLWAALYYDTEKYILSLVPSRALGRLHAWMSVSNS
jgi:hypothetical protein